MSRTSDLIRAAAIFDGVSGAFAHDLLAKPCDTLIICSLDDEPTLHPYSNTAVEWSRSIVAGIRIVSELIGSRTNIVALSRDDREALESFQKLSDKKLFRVEKIDPFYPAANPMILTHAITGQVPLPGRTPLDLGCLVLSVQTLRMIADAVGEICPCQVTTMVTVAGAVERPCTFETTVGATFDALIEEAGGPTAPSFTIIENGAMSGRIADRVRGVVTKETRGLLVMPDESELVERRSQSPAIHQRRVQSACEQCHICTDFCPPNLLGQPLFPDRIARANLAAKPAAADVLSAGLCIDCGICSLWACPIPLPIREVVTQTAASLRKHKIKSPYRDGELAGDAHAKNRRVPTSELIRRLGLETLDHPAPFRPALFSPGRIFISIFVPSGAPSTPIVEVGDNVSHGDVLANFPDSSDPFIHSPIDGRVISMRDGRIEIGR